jgi:hypothetical protein
VSGPGLQVLVTDADHGVLEAEVELRRKAAGNVVSWARTGRPDHVVVEGR